MANLGAGQSRTLGAGNQTLGYEWDLDVDNGFRPRGTFQLSSTTVSGVESFTDFGTFTKQGTTQTHHLTEYKAPSGAIVFGAGTVQWAWGLDDTNAWNNNGPPAGATPDPVMQQATVNLFADMGVPATTLMSGLTAVSQSTDTTAPNSTISSPSAGAAIADGSTVTISGTASDAGGQVAGIEVSTDGGSTWHPATGTTSWSYSWNAHGSPTSTIMSRATDDSGNVESSSPSATVNVTCPCTMQGPGVTPWVLDQQDPTPVEVGVRFKSDVDGQITGVRFYKSTANTGSHIGNLWTASGTRLATGTFSGESATGWQQLTFTTPVDITAGTTYVASYYAPRGHYSVSSEYYYTPSPVGGNSLDSPPLHAINANRGGANGVYSYAGASTFPSSTFDGENYAVDVVFAPKLPPGPVSNVTATPGPGSATVTFNAPVTGGPPTRYVVTPFIGSTAQTSVTVTGTPPATSVTIGDLTPGTSYTFKVQAGNGSGTSALSAASNAVTPNAPVGAGRSDGRGGERRQPAGDRALDRARRRRAHDHQVHGHAVPQRRRPGDDVRDRLARPDAGGRHRPQQRLGLHLHRVGHQLGRHRAGVVALRRGHSERVAAVRAEGDGQHGDRREPAAHARPGHHDRQPHRRHGRHLELQRGDDHERQRPAGNTYTKVASVKASDDTELSVWTAPITAGGGTKPAITVTATGGADIGAAAMEYSGLSTAAGAAAVDQLKTATGTATAAGFVTSGPTPALTGDNGLAMGFYADSGFSRTLSADPSYTERVNVSPRHDMEFVIEDALPLRGDTPAARVSTGSNTPWTMATVVFKSGTVSPPALSVSPDEPGLQRHGGRREPGGQDADGDQRRRRDDELDGLGERELADPVAHERDQQRHDHGDPVDHRPGGGHLHDRRDGDRERRRRLAQDDPRDLHRRSADAADAHRVADEPVLHGHAGRLEPGGQDARRSATPAAGRWTGRPRTARPG